MPHAPQLPCPSTRLSPQGFSACLGLLRARWAWCGTEGSGLSQAGSRAATLLTPLSCHSPWVNTVTGPVTSKEVETQTHHGTGSAQVTSHCIARSHRTALLSCVTWSLLTRNSETPGSQASRKSPAPFLMDTASRTSRGWPQILPSPNFWKSFYYASGIRCIWT